MKTGPMKSNIARKSILLALLLVVIINVSCVYALTANIGNARMVLRANIGDTIEKTILVKNINNESIDISVFPSGDLMSDITVKDTNFSLAPNEEKNARFTIKVKKEGTTESKINVKFFSPTEKKGVGLSSTVIVIVNSSETSEDNTDTTDNTDDNPDNTGNTDTTNKPSRFDFSSLKLSPLMMLFAVTGIILLVFLVILVIYYFKSKKGTEKNGEVVVKETKPKKKVSEK